MTSFSEADAELRQEKFELALGEHWAALGSAGVTPEFVRAAGGQVSVSISLCPKSGQAGIVLNSRVLDRLSILSADVYVDAFR
jgi:hypothetical protein